MSSDRNDRHLAHAWRLITQLLLVQSTVHAMAVLHEWGLSELADDAALIVSELRTNALDASSILPERPPITLRLLTDEKSLLIEAWDQCPLDLELGQVDADAECGRGLTVVAALSERWGWERTGYRRKVVWAELAVLSPQG